MVARMSKAFRSQEKSPTYPSLILDQCSDFSVGLAEIRQKILRHRRDADDDGTEQRNGCEMGISD